LDEKVSYSACMTKIQTTAFWEVQILLPFLHQASSYLVVTRWPLLKTFLVIIAHVSRCERKWHSTDTVPGLRIKMFYVRSWDDALLWTHGRRRFAFCYPYLAIPPFPFAENSALEEACRGKWSRMYSHVRLLQSGFWLYLHKGVCVTCAKCFLPRRVTGERAGTQWVHATHTRACTYYSLLLAAF
jgi:hypothetical protein